MRVNIKNGNATVRSGDPATTIGCGDRRKIPDTGVTGWVQCTALHVSKTVQYSMSLNPRCLLYLSKQLENSASHPTFKPYTVVDSPLEC